MLPLVGRQADMWNTGTGRGLEAFQRKRDIVHRSAEEAGRDPSSIVLTVTREAPLPQNSDESAQWVEELRRWQNEGVSHFLCDFGHVTSTEPVLRFVEEVIKPLKG
jgi:alkanesulfonate monooxygenase SsuD/methylene tetrahydromethanopterin reductase-like flavin-dependent oxidoreductase (luciferase family)